jgi:hypothetical protein
MQFSIKNFLNEAIELNSHFLKLKIQTEAERLLPFEEDLKALKEHQRIPDNLPALLDKIKAITRLKQELKLNQQLATSIKRETC